MARAEKVTLDAHAFAVMAAARQVGPHAAPEAAIAQNARCIVPYRSQASARSRLFALRLSGESTDLSACALVRLHLYQAATCVRRSGSSGELLDNRDRHKQE